MLIKQQQNLVRKQDWSFLKNIQQTDKNVLMNESLENLVYKSMEENEEEALLRRGVHYVGKSKKPRPSLYINPDKKQHERMVQFLLRKFEEKESQMAGTSESEASEVWEPNMQQDSSS